MLPLKSSIQIRLIIEAFHSAIQNESLLLLLRQLTILKMQNA
jgi:hypothetical protein